MLIRVTEPDPQLLRDYVSLRDVSLRRSLESSEGLFIGEGAKIIRRAIEAGYAPRSFLLAERWVADLEDLLAKWPDVPAFVVTEELAEAITGFHVHRGALGSFHRRVPRPLADLLGAGRLVICEDIVDHTNVGAIIRCAAGLGWDGVVLAPGAADPLYRRAIKTAMGTVFSLPWARMSDTGTDLETLRAAGFTLAGMALAQDAVPLNEYAPPEKLAIMLGTEGAGLSRDWLAHADIKLRIPMSHGVDSLNVAAAAAVTCYALGRT